MRNVIILSLLFLASCGKANKWPANVTIDSSLNTAMANEIVAYTFDLNRELKENAFGFGSAESRYPITIKYSSTPGARPLSAGMALIYHNRCEITIYPLAITHDILKSVLWHEYGHCIGMEHLDISGELMSPGVRQFITYDQNSINLFINAFKQFLFVVSR